MLFPLNHQLPIFTVCKLPCLIIYWRGFPLASLRNWNQICPPPTLVALPGIGSPPTWDIFIYLRRIKWIPALVWSKRNRLGWRIDIHYPTHIWLCKIEYCCYSWVGSGQFPLFSLRYRNFHVNSPYLHQFRPLNLLAAVPRKEDSTTFIRITVVKRVPLSKACIAK